MMPQLGMCVCLCVCLSQVNNPSYGLGSVYLPSDRFHRVILSLESPTAGFDVQFIFSYVFFVFLMIIFLFLKDDVSLIEYQYFTQIQCSEDGAKRNVYVPSSVNLRYSKFGISKVEEEKHCLVGLMDVDRVLFVCMCVCMCVCGGGKKIFKNVNV